MSLLSSFASQGHAVASAVIGVETVTIDGGDGVAAVLNEIVTARDFESGGHAPSNTLRAVIKTTVFNAAYSGAAGSYLGKDATARGVTMTVSSISKGALFVEIELEDEEAAR